jgi:hypothetical protein
MGRRVRLIRGACVSLLVFASVIPFSSSARNALVWDDHLLLTSRLAPDQCRGFGDIWRQPYWGPRLLPDTYRPLSLSLIYAEKRIFRESVLPYRAVTLGMHAVTVLLLAALIGTLAGEPLAFAAALLFAVHPVHAEAVDMVYGQLELLAALFSLLAAGFYVQARRGGLRPAPFAAALVCAALAACCKESALMLPALLMLIRAVWMTGSGRPAERLSLFLNGLGWDALFLVVEAPYLLLRYRALGSLAPNPEATVTLGYTLPLRIKTMVVALGHSIRLCIFPTGQSLYYGHLRDSLWGWPIQELTWILLAAVALAWLWPMFGRRNALFGAAWFLLTLAPVANVVPSGVMVAERTLYMPSAGLCFLGAAALAHLAKGGPMRSRLAAVTLTGVVVAGAFASVTVTGYWRDEETLWRTTVSAHPRSPFAQYELGESLLNRWANSGIDPDTSELQTAAEAFSRAYALNPGLAEALAGSRAVEEIRLRKEHSRTVLMDPILADPLR